MTKVRLYLGLSGTGKTKEMIRAINEAAETSKGSVVCIEKGNKLRYDVNFRVRLITYSEYGLLGADALKAFVSGLHAGNFDITHIFLKSIHRLLASSTYRSTSGLSPHEQRESQAEFQSSTQDEA